MAKAPSTEQMSAEMREKGRQAFLEPSEVKQRMYHGTGQDIRQFKPKQAGASFVTPNPKFAHDFADLSESWMKRNVGTILTGEQIERAKDLTAKEMTKHQTRRNMQSLEREIALIGSPQAHAFTQTLYANKLAEQLPSAQNIMPVHVQAKKPFDYENPKHIHAVRTMLHKLGHTQHIDDFDTAMRGEYAHEANWQTIESKPVQQAIRALGHDSFWVKEGGVKNLGVYNPGAIKSAIGNRGTYDTEDYDVNKAQGGAVHLAAGKSVGQMSAEMREKGRQAFLKPSEVKDVLYHGSLNDINEFKPGAKGLLGPGVYLTPHAKAASGYASFRGRIKGDATGSNVVPVHAQIKNPYYFDNDPLVPMTSEHVERLKALGHDAAILRDTEGGINQVNVFHPHQIKSAIGNRGTYDTTNPDITKAQGGAVHPTINQMRQAIAARQAMPRLAGGGEPPATPHPGYLPTDNPKRVLMPAEGPGGIKGIVQPSHMWLGGKLPGGSRLAGMGEINEARASVYGGEQRPPLKIGQVGALHKRILDAHFQKPVAQQLADESSALEKLKAAKHISGNANTLDKSEKLDTVNHETDSEGRHYTGIASKGVAGHSLYTSGHGAEQKRHVINTCPGQTVGCGGGVDANGIVDTSKGICFAPNAEAQYAGAAIRRACHEQAKHDPAMSPDWILAHTGSLRGVANAADKQNKVTLFRPNVVDETDVSSRHVLRHLNKQRRAEGKPGMIANSYGKTNELHDPENGYYVTHSNVGPKTKLGTSIEDHIARDKQRVRNTITATDASGRDFTNDDGNPTPPKNAYAVTDVKRHSPFDQRMQKTITHAKYWGVGKHVEELTPAEKAEGPEGHFNGAGKPVAEDAAHYGHTTVNNHRYDYQKQHILHPRLVQVGKNIDGTPHMIPTDSRFKDDDFLPKNRFKTKNGKQAGAIILTTPTESTSNLQHQASFTHHVGEEDIAHAQARKGEYEIDAPAKQEASRGKEYVQPKGIKFFAHGGSVHITGGRHEGLADDDFSAFPERNFAAQWHHSKRVGIEDITEMPHGHAHQRQKAPVVRAKAGGAIGNVSMDEMLAHTTLGRKMPNVRNIGADEAPDMKVKQYISPGPGKGNTLPAGGVDFQPEMPGHQLTQAAPAGPGGPAMPGMPGMPPGGLGMPPGAPGPGMPGMPPPLPRNQPGMPTGKPAGLEPPNIPPPKQKPTGSNILSMTPQGQALAALGPTRKMADGGSVERMKLELAEKKKINRP